MIENPGVAAVVAVIAGAMGWTTRSRLPRAILWSGAAILVAAWGPLLGSSAFSVQVSTFFTDFHKFCSKIKALQSAAERL